MATPNPHQLALLTSASQRLRKDDYRQYLRLKVLLKSDRDEDRQSFGQLFTQYYGLRFVSAEFKGRFFELLFGLEVPGNPDPYTPIMKELYEFPWSNGKRELAFSFVSKLVGMHDELQPLYDRHVRNFFGLFPPELGSVEFRIAGFTANLDHIRNIYESWARDSNFRVLMDDLLSRHPDLHTCHLTRICDLLVWTVGNQQLDNHEDEVRYESQIDALQG